MNNSNLATDAQSARPALPAAKDKLLFTPGPLTTSLSVKQAMLHDAGSWHFEFNALVADVRERLLQLAGVARATGWEVVPLQGSGTFGVEAVFQTCVPAEGKVAVLTNGAYGDRIVQMLKHARIAHAVLRALEDQPVDPDALDQLLAQDKAVTHIAVVHCETTTGIINPIEAIGRVARKHGKIHVVDAMSSFGAIPIDFEACGIDFLISSANKCIEGVPGFAFVFCRRQVLIACEGYARSLSLDLLGQLKGFEKNGQFRYTPPTHALLAFHQALEEIEQEGGVAARGARYRRNHETLMAGMGELGFRALLPAPVQSYIITAFRTPADPQFSFEAFYRQLSDRGFIIYPGKLTQVDTFRIGNIGRLFPSDLEQLVHAIRGTMREMGCAVPVRYSTL
ncbi:MAG: 2-aminoethylphosphonate--pyruvate transaminase [Verrucomicrobiota bacterium]|jgi:2-aminoethylphosphonate-pyruvate transaminase